MLPYDLDPEWVLRDYKARLDTAEYERMGLRVASGQPGLIARLLIKLANLMIALGVHLRDSACHEPCEPVSEPARL